MSRNLAPNTDAPANRRLTYLSGSLPTVSPGVLVKATRTRSARRVHAQGINQPCCEHNQFTFVRHSLALQQCPGVVIIRNGEFPPGFDCASRLARSRFTRCCCKLSSLPPRQPPPSRFRAKLASIVVSREQAAALRAAIPSGITDFAAFWLALPRPAPMSVQRRRSRLSSPNVPPLLSFTRSPNGYPRERPSSIISPRAVHPPSADYACRPMSRGLLGDTCIAAWRNNLASTRHGPLSAT